MWIVQDLYGTWETSRPFDVSSASEAEAALEDTDIIVEVDSLAVATYDVAAGDGYTYTIRLSNPAHVTTIALEGKACNDAGCYGKRAMTDAEKQRDRHMDQLTRQARVFVQARSG